MKFGLNFFPSFRAEDMSTAEYYAQTLRLAERADALGFNSVKAVEHYFHDYGGHTVNPIVLLAAIAARTKRVRLVTGAVIPAFNHPIKLAGELAMLDNLSDGRVEAGFGRAFIPREFDVFQVSMDDSRERFDEGVAVIRRLWTEDRVTHEGKFHQFKDVHLMPRPVQQPHPPVWIAAISTPESFVWAGQNGCNLMIVPFAGKLERNAELVRMYRDAWASAGHPPGAEQVQMSIHVCIAESRDEAVQTFKKPLARYVEVFGEAVGSWEGRSSGKYAGYDKLVDAIRAQTWETMIDGKVAVVGSPEDAVRQMQEYREIFGEVEPSMQVNFGGMREADALRTVELLARDVIPRLASSSAVAAR